jgi:hypothetical protein
MPHAWHTLDETLSELPSADSAVRDGMTVQHARHRSERLLRFVRSHLVPGETTCHEERRTRAHGWKVAPSAAAADEGGVVWTLASLERRCNVRPCSSRLIVMCERSTGKLGS